MALGAGLAYFLFEDARAAIFASLPVLALLLCPISMLVMMKFMHDGAGNSCDSKLKEKAEAPEPGRVRNVTGESA